MVKKIEPKAIFGHLTVLAHVGSNRHGQAVFACKCSCGEQVIVPGYKLRRGEARSCGCQKAALRLATMAEKDNVVAVRNEQKEKIVYEE